MKTTVFVHEKGLCETGEVGAGTRIWAFTHILPGAKIGSNCNICDHVFIENDVVVGNDVTIKCGVQLWDGVRIGNSVFIGPNATFTNDRFPRSKRYPDAFLTTILEDGVSIGANATILPGRRIGTGAMIGAGAVVTRDVPPFAIVAGNPATIIGYQRDDERVVPLTDRAPGSADKALGNDIGARQYLDVAGCYLERLPHFSDMRGSLTALEADRGAPFEPKRVFFVYDVMSNHIRGEHAHRNCEQFLIAVNSSVSVMLDDGFNRAEARLTDQTVGLYIAPMVWGTQYKFARDSVLAVVASERYDDSDYIRDYDQFRALAQPRP